MMKRLILLVSLFTIPLENICAQSAKSDSLFAIGVDLYNAKQYELAIPIFAQCDSIDKAEMDSTSNRRGYSAMWLASCYYQLGDTITAKETDRYYKFQPVDRRLTVKSDSLSDRGGECYQEGNYGDAVQCFIQCAEIEKSVVGDKHIWYGNTLITCARIFYNLNDSIHSLSYMNEGMKLIRENYGAKSKQYADLLNEFGNVCISFHFSIDTLSMALDSFIAAYHILQKEESYDRSYLDAISGLSIQLGNSYLQSGEYQRAISNFKISAEFQEIQNHKLSPAYAATIGLIGYGYSLMKDYEKAKQFTLEAIRIHKDAAVNDVSGSMISLENLASYEKALKNYDKAIDLYEELLGIEEKRNGKSIKYIYYLDKMANVYDEKEDYTKYIETYTTILELYKNMGKDQTLEYANGLSTLASGHKKANNFKKSVECEEQALQIKKEQLGEEHQEYIASLYQLSDYLYQSGDYKNAIDSCKKAIVLFERILGKDESSYSSLLHSLAFYYDEYGNFSEAIIIGEECVSILEKVFGKESPKYVVSLSLLANYYDHFGKYSIAEKKAKEALMIAEKIYNKRSRDYCAFLSRLARIESHQGKHQEALRLSTEILGIAETIFGKDNSEYAACLGNHSGFLASLGNYKEAVRLTAEVMTIQENIFGKEHPKCAITLANLAGYQSSLGNYTEALRLATEALTIQEKTLGKENSNYALTLANLAGYQSSLGNYTEALRLATEALTIQEKALGKEHPNYATALFNLAECQSSLGNYKESLRLATEALTIQEKALGKENPNYSVMLGALAGYQSSMGNYKEALRLATEALEIKEKTIGTEHPVYAITLGALAGYQSSMGNYKESLRLAAEALAIQEKTLGKEHPDYATTLSKIANIQMDLDNYDEALRLNQEALKIREKVFGKANPTYALSLQSIYDYYFQVNNFDAAYKYLDEALKIMKGREGKDNLEYANLLERLAQYESEMGNYTKALQTMEEVLSIRDKYQGKSHPAYANALITTSVDYMNLGNYEEAITHIQNAIKIQEVVYGKKNTHYASSLNVLGGCYSEKGEQDKAIEAYKEAISVEEELYGKNRSAYVRFLHNLALAISRSGDNKEAIRIEEFVLKLRADNDKYSPLSYAISLNNLSLFYLNNKQYREALKTGENALEKIYNIWGYDNVEIVKTLMKICKAEYEIGEPNKMFKYSADALNTITTNTLRSFSSLTSRERNLLWANYNAWLTKDLCQFVYRFPSDSMCVTAYSGTLFNKGLLLNSEIELKKIVMEEGNSEIKSMYEELQTKRSQLQKLYEKANTDRETYIDSLERVTEIIEKRLTKSSKKYGDFTRNLHVEWKQIKEKLSQHDIAIEFASFPLNNDSTMYIAFVLKKNMDSPKMVRLFEESQIKGIHNPYSNTDVAALVWQPLSEYMTDANNVYFGVSGELYNIAIEQVPHWSEDCLMSDKWNIYRLSSTRELALIKDRNNVNKASVYGGIKYDTDEQVLANDSKRYGGKREMSMELFDIADSLNLRSGVAYLPATRTEAENIDKTLEQKRITTTLKLDTLATEGAFKDLSGKRTNLLHIATHGFYWTEREVQYRGDLDFLMLNDKHSRYVEDKAMTRSGLLFAGANNALTGKKLPEGVNDGILTAKEIARLDLRGLDLVVLSACQTGLGEIKGDGVFGLQRGFKKAGANSLMMSLWKVDDNATQMLMTEFYKNLTSGKSKHESLKLAQKYVREYEKEVEIRNDAPAGQALIDELTNVERKTNKEKQYKKIRPYAKPEYWAAFILLDAID